MHDSPSIPHGRRPQGKHKAFVAGATGYTGLALVELLCGQGIETWAHIRPDSPKLEHWSGYFGEQGARISNAAWKSEAMRGALEEIQPSLIFALLGTTRARASAIARSGGSTEGETYEKVDYGLSAMLIRSAEVCKGLSRFVYLSAAGTRAGSKSRYMRARWRVEEDLRASNLPYTMVRPAMITGPDRLESRPLEVIGAGVLDASLALLASIGFRRPSVELGSIGGAELGKALFRLALDPEWENRIAFRRDLSDP